MPDDLQHFATTLAERYTIRHELGRGGMATVYLATDLRHDRPVALKVLRPDLAAALGAERFLREIRTTASLSHPHILPLLDSGDAGGALFYVMPYVAGESLRDRLVREKQLPVEEAVGIAREVADALSYAHTRGVVHRDIKPENVLLESGHAVVADFGIARAVGQVGQDRLTSTGLAIGTPAYMSPEQAAGEATLDGRSDLYSLGCVLYEMLVGEPPHRGPTVQASIAKRLGERPPSARATRDSVPEALDRAITRALATVPADRHVTVEQFARDLARAGSPTLPPAPAVRSKLAGLHGLLTRRGARMGAAAALAIGALLAARSLVTGGPSEQAVPTSADPAIAVLPFRVVGPDLEFWREGMVDLLSFNLDGIGGLRKIEPAAVLRGLEAETGRMDLRESEAALAVGRRVGASRAVTGSVLRVGGSLRVLADVYDVSSGAHVGAAAIEGHPDSVAQVVDGLTMALLREGLLPLAGAMPGIQLSQITTTSLPALRAYMDGERAYRQGRWAEALEHYEGALALDSTFALAMHRAIGAIGWGGGSSRLAAHYHARLAPHLHRLPRRAAMLVGAQSSDDPDAIEALEEYTRRYPDDPDGWFALGDHYTHYGAVALHPADASREPFLRALALNSGGAEPYYHLIEMAFLQRDSGWAGRLIADYGRHLGLSGQEGCTYELAYALAWGDHAARSRAVAALDTVSTLASLFDCLQAPMATPPPTSDALAALYRRALLSSSHEMQRVALFRLLLVRVPQGQAVAARNALHEVVNAPDSRSGLRIFASRWELMLHLSGFPDAEGARRAARILTEERRTDSLTSEIAVHPDGADATSHFWPDATSHFWLGALAIDEDRWDDARLARITIDSIASALRGLGRTRDAGWAEALARALRAFEALVRGDRGRIPEFEAALRRLRPHGYTTEQPQQFLRYRVGSLLREWGDLARAERYFLTFRPYDYFYTSLADLQLGRIYEAAGRRDDAATRYGRFLVWWEFADPDLQPLVEEARDAIAQLEGKDP